MDFKGYFLTGDGYRCDPFTITDAHSRFLIRCQAVARMDLAQVSAVCDAAMREFGVPSWANSTVQHEIPSGDSDVNASSMEGQSTR